ncbi:MAG: hypothetical protein ACRDHE_07015 [Ktedonobacterales bacterium]
MSDQYDGQSPDGEPSPEIAETARRLATDAALWSARLPSAERVAQHAREAPYALPRPPVTDAAVAPAPTVRTTRNILPMRGDESMPASRIRAFIAVAAAVVVVALLAVLFSTFGKGHAPNSTIVGSGGPPSTPSGNITTYVTAIPTQSSPYARYVTNIVTANDVDSQNNPVGPSTQFFPNQGIFVVMRVSNPPAGTHVVQVVWLLFGSSAPFAGSEVVAQPITGSATIYFSVSAPASGQGQVRILWDPPAGDQGTDPTDPHLVATISFSIVMPQTPTPGPTPTTGPTPTPSA